MSGGFDATEILPRLPSSQSRLGVGSSVGALLVVEFVMFAICTPWLRELPSLLELVELVIMLGTTTAGIVWSVVDGCRPLTLVFSTFVFAWLGIGPLYQLAHRVSPWNDWASLEQYGSPALLSLDVFVVCFYLCWFCTTAGARQTARPQTAAPVRARSRLGPNGWPALALAAVLLPKVIDNVGGVSGLFTSRAQVSEALSRSGLTLTQAGGLALALVSTLPAAAALTAMLAFAWRALDKQITTSWLNDVGLAGAIFFSVLYCNPLSSTRFIMVAAFGSLAVLLLRPVTRRAGTIFAVVAMLGTVVVYPLLSLFKTSNGTAAASYSAGFQAFGGADFDGYLQSANTIPYVHTYGYGMGKYISSALLYFVPRAIWATKAQPASLDIAAARNYVFINLSLPLPSEFYLEFGILGVIVLGLGWGWLWSVLDARWVARRLSGFGMCMVAFLSCGQLGLMRGPLGSNGPLFFTIVIMIIMVFSPLLNPGALLERIVRPAPVTS